MSSRPNVQPHALPGLHQRGQHLLQSNSAQSSIMQPKPGATTPIGRQPEAPPAYRPLPVPRVLQTRLTNGKPNPLEPRLNLTRRVELYVGQSQRPPAVSQPKMIPLQPKAGDRGIRPVVPLVIARRVVPRTSVQRFKSAVVQATKFYPNLHPGAVEPIDESNIFRLNSFADQYRLHKVNSHGVNVPNQQYNFVRTGQGEMLLHSRYRHPSIAEGKQVLYAGEIFFNNGKLQWWSNGSGHYQPDKDSAEQANLPMDSFFSYQQIIKGEHTRRKGELAR